MYCFLYYTIFKITERFGVTVLYFEIIYWYVNEGMRYAVLAQDFQIYFERLERKSSRMAEVTRSILIEVILIWQTID